jgi:hypothetical protein
MKNLLRLLIRVLLITLIAVVVVGGIGLIARWQTAVQYSDGLFWAGAALAGVGILGTFSNKDIGVNSGAKFLSASPQERQASLAGMEDPQERVRRAGMVTSQGFNTYLSLFISAALIIVIGYLITV